MSTEDNIPTKGLECLNDLGEQWRGDWSDFDGRTLRDQLDDIAEIIRRECRGDEDVDDYVAGFRSNWLR